MKLIKIDATDPVARKIFRCTYYEALSMCCALGLGMYSDGDREVITDADGMYCGAFCHAWDDIGIGRLYIWEV